jgi:hypothetical protein
MTLIQLANLADRQCMDEERIDRPSYGKFSLGAILLRFQFCQICDRMPRFQTDSTQIDRSGPHTLRHSGQPTNAQMPMNTKKAAHSAAIPADPPSASI